MPLRGLRGSQRCESLRAALAKAAHLWKRKEMLPDLSVAPHWPEQRPRMPCETHQDALRIIAEIRRMICAYRREEVRDWRYKHATEECIVNVVAGLIADARAIDKLHEAASNDATRLAEQNTTLRERLAESKRPFSAQMEMQNRRIIALTAELDELRFQLKASEKP